MLRRTTMGGGGGKPKCNNYLFCKAQQRNIGGRFNFTTVKSLDFVFDYLLFSQT
jgi:hypothetical protein